MSNNVRQIIGWFAYLFFFNALQMIVRDDFNLFEILFFFVIPTTSFLQKKTHKSTIHILIHG